MMKRKFRQRSGNRIGQRDVQERNHGNYQETAYEGSRSPQEGSLLMKLNVYELNPSLLHTDAKDGRR